MPKHTDEYEACVSLHDPCSCLEVDSDAVTAVTGRSTLSPGGSSRNLLDSESQLLPVDPKQHHRHSRTASELLGDRWAQPTVEHSLKVPCFAKLTPDMMLYRQFFIEELEESREFFRNQNRPLKLLFAMYNLLAANSELVCYFIIVLNNMVSASAISLVLPILVFLWAMLSAPRPTKRFWMTAIVYTEVGTRCTRTC